MCWSLLCLAVYWLLKSCHCYLCPLISLNLCNLNAVDIFCVYYFNKKNKKVSKKKNILTENLFYSPVPRYFLSITLIMWQQYLKSQHIFKQCCVQPQSGPKYVRHSKSHDTVFLVFFFSICKVQFHLLVFTWATSGCLWLAHLSNSPK